MTINTLIIGAGKKGAMSSLPGDSNVLSFAHALSIDDRFKIVGFVDSSYRASKRAAYIYHTNFYGSVLEAFKANEIDMVIVSASTENRESNVRELIEYTFKWLLLEKPISDNIENAMKIMELIGRSRVKTLVNYTRRFLPEFIEISKAIEDGRYGTFLGGVGTYGKGVVNNASHMLDLVQYLLSYRFKRYIILDKEVDYSDVDLDVVAMLFVENGSKFFLNYISSEFVTEFSFTLFFSEAKIDVSELGMKIFIKWRSESKEFPGYFTYEGEESYDTDLENGLIYILDEIAKCEQNNYSKFKSNINEAFYTLSVCEQLLKGNIHDEKDIVFDDRGWCDESIVTDI